MGLTVGSITVIVGLMYGSINVQVVGLMDDSM